MDEVREIRQNDGSRRRKCAGCWRYEYELGGVGPTSMSWAMLVFRRNTRACWTFEKDAQAHMIPVLHSVGV